MAKRLSISASVVPSSAYPFSVIDLD